MNSNMNAYEEAEGAFGCGMDAVYRCVECTEDHLCEIHCAACYSQDYVGNHEPCERQLEEDKLNG